MYNNAMRKGWTILIYFLTIVLMIGLIPFFTNDTTLSVVYCVFIIVLMMVRSEKNDWLALFLGLVGVTICEYFFVSTGEEIFVRHSLFNIMPLWLPLLWAYVFVVIKRSLRILES